MTERGATAGRTRAAVDDLRVQLGLLRSCYLPGAPPAYSGFGEPMNGQRNRLRTVRRLIERFQPDAIIETGTQLGATANWLAELDKPVYTVELKTLLALAARFNTRKSPNVIVSRGDSADFLGQLSRRRDFERPFAYLDAHWYGEMPLRSELGQLFGTWQEAIAVIDDFQVPGEDYYYADQDGYKLTIDLLELPAGVRVAYPAEPAEEETGPRSGSVYLAQGEEAATTIDVLAEERLLRVER
jgi:hypothetical protein